MAKIVDVLGYIEEIAPTENRCEWDNDGLQVCGDTDTDTNSVLLCLDVTDKAIDSAIKEGAKLIISHHPLIFQPVKSISTDVPESRLAIRLLDSGISLIAAHTRLDKAADGVNETLANTLGIKNIEHFGEENIGIIGDIDSKTCKELALFAKEKLNVPSVSYVLGEKNAQRLAVVCGSGKDFLLDAKSSGADALLTGDVSYTAFVIAQRYGIALIDAGHFYTEFPILSILENKLRKRFPELKISVYKEAIKEEI